MMFEPLGLSTGIYAGKGCFLLWAGALGKPVFEYLLSVQQYNGTSLWDFNLCPAVVSPGKEARHIHHQSSIKMTR